ncbi:MAG: hypothetical protein QG639_14, partial [Patescibacteria group bacterium]|nr:hypothetical protein [Patescibacteria group bacterium]
LPFFHMHTFLVCLCLLVWFLIGLIDKKKLTIKQAVFMAIPAALGVFQLLFVASEKSFLSLDLGWLAEQVNIFTFWWRNMGLSLLLLFIPPALFWKQFQKNDFEKLLLLPAVGIFILCNIFVFQPNPWDNMKFFSLGFVLSAIIAAAVLTKYWQTPLAKIGISALLVLTSISGILSIIFVSQNSFTVATKQDLHLAAAVTETPPESIFLTADTHNHPVPMLAGRAVVRGYRGWLWTHGIDYQQTDRDIENIYRGVTATDLLKKYSVDYVYIGPYERNQYQIDEEFFKARYRTIYQDNTTTIYKIADVNLGQLPQL